MKDDIMDSLNNGFGRQKNYTAEEIEEATKMKKKYGGTLLENLQKLTGRGLPNGVAPANQQTIEMLERQQKELDEFRMKTDANISDRGSYSNSDSKKPEYTMQGETGSNGDEEKSTNPFSAFWNGFTNGVQSARKDGKKNQESKDKANRYADEPSNPIRDYVNNSLGKDSKKGSQDLSDIQSQLMQNQAYLDKELEKYTNDLRNDFNIDTYEMNERINKMCAEDMGIINSQAGQRETNAVVADPQAVIEKFDGLTEEISEKVFGQKEYIHKLTIAFKRPVVLPPEKDHALNSILVTGKKKTGRHLGLKTTAEVLKKRGVLRSAELETINLALYSEASADKLFLQDLFAALSSNSRIILFENLEECHSSFLTQLADLVIDGRCMLSERYTMQNGQLVNVSNSLASEAVSYLSAAGKYLVFVSEKPLDKVAGIMGAPFINALGDVCSTGDLNDEAYKKIIEKEFEDLKATADRQFKFSLSHEEDFVTYALSKTEKQEGLDGILKFFDDLMQSLVTLKLEKDYPKGTEIKLVIKDGKVIAANGEEETDLLASLPGGYTGEIDKIKKEMDEIVGLEKVKQYIFSLEEYYSVQQRRRDEGLKTSEVSKHMIFTGSPGTGKTTIARIISKYLKAIGVLTGGQLVEVSRADLVGRYVGHTAPLTNKVVQSAIGGVLFIDEAYSLYRGKDDSFGLEAIDTLVKGIEDNRDNLIVILAGYSNEMQEFLTSNSGLKSRFPNVINFPDYTGEELLLIAKSIAKSKGYVVDEGADNGLLSYFNAVQAIRPKDAGNGRLARNKIEGAILNQSRRLVAEKDAELSTLLSQDFDLTDIVSDEK